MPTKAPRLLGERVLLRLARRKDARALARYYAENDLHLCRYESPKPRAFQDAAFWKREVDARASAWLRDESCRLFLFPVDRSLGAARGEVIGSIGLTSIVRGVFQGAWVGYSLAERLQGRGLMHEALLRLVGFAFDEMNLHRLMASSSTENARSRRVLERAGFREEGIAPDYLLINGIWQDHVITARTNPRWRAPPGFLMRTEDDRIVQVPAT